jgi:hypothetical protein
MYLASLLRNELRSFAGPANRSALSSQLHSALSCAYKPQSSQTHYSPAEAISPKEFLLRRFMIFLGGGLSYFLPKEIYHIFGENYFGSFY